MNTGRNTTIPDSLLGTSAAYPQTNIHKGQLNGTAGGEIDFHITKPGVANGSVILGLRYGLSAMLIDGHYRANTHRVDYNPGWEFRKSYFGLMIKLVGN